LFSLSDDERKLDSKWMFKSQKRGKETEMTSLEIPTQGCMASSQTQYFEGTHVLFLLLYLYSCPFLTVHSYINIIYTPIRTYGK
jgi:hypothetical protein